MERLRSDYGINHTNTNTMERWSAYKPSDQNLMSKKRILHCPTCLNLGEADQVYLSIRFQRKIRWTSYFLVELTMANSTKLLSFSILGALESFSDSNMLDFREKRLVFTVVFFSISPSSFPWFVHIFGRMTSLFQAGICSWASHPFASSSRQWCSQDPNFQRSNTRPTWWPAIWRSTSPSATTWSIQWAFWCWEKWKSGLITHL